MSRRRLGLTDIRKLASGETVWDGLVPLFGARRQRGDAVAYVLKYRTAEGRQRWYTIGRHGAPWTPDTARDEAKRLLGEVVHGRDPAADKTARRNALTVGDLCDQYLADAEAGRLLTRRKTSKKPTTLATDKGRIERHIKPLLGRLAVVAVTREDVDTFMHDVADGKTAGGRDAATDRELVHVTGGRGTASRTIGLLGAIFTYAVRKRMRADNPVRGVVRFADGRRDRRLNDLEYAALGDCLRLGNDSGIWPPALAAARFLALTGWRSGEVLGLTWSDLDLTRHIATLPDTKTGKSNRCLSTLACDLLREQHHAGDLVFPGSRGGGRMSSFTKLWGRIAALGSLPKDITPHVLRHTFASIAADLGYTELTIAALLGHKGQTVTSGYVHSADDVLLAAADRIAMHIWDLITRPYPTQAAGETLFPSEHAVER